MLLSALLRDTDGLEAAEDALQDAVTAALETWPRTGMPENPAAWLLTTARHKAIDRFRRDAIRPAKVAAAQASYLSSSQVESAATEGQRLPLEADQLRLMFACCHPSLSLASQAALTLKAVAGLTTEELAACFLVRPATMTRRITRAKDKVRDAAVRLVVPPDAELAQRLPAVLAVVHLLFTTGYQAYDREVVVRADLCDEGLRLGRLVVDVFPGEAEPLGLLSLMLLVDARRPARVDRRGELVLLGDQNRRLWVRAEIDEGVETLNQARSLNQVGRFQIQAAINVVHDSALRAEDTNWVSIKSLYEALTAFDPSPMTQLNRTIAVAMVDGPEAGLGALHDTVGDQLASHPRFHSTRADFLRRLGDAADASDAYRLAVSLCNNAPERRFLQRRLHDLDASAPGLRGAARF